MSVYGQTVLGWSGGHGSWTTDYKVGRTSATSNAGEKTDN